MRGGPKPRPGRQAASIRLALIGAAFLVSLAAPAVAVYAPLEEIPVEDRLYQDLESLALRYDAGIHFLSLRPWSRGEARSFLEQVRNEAPEAAQDPSFRRVERQVIEDAEGAAWQGGVEGAWIRNGEGRLGQPWLPTSGTESGAATGSQPPPPVDSPRVGH